MVCVVLLPLAEGQRADPKSVRSHEFSLVNAKRQPVNELVVLTDNRDLSVNSRKKQSEAGQKHRPVPGR